MKIFENLDKLKEAKDEITKKNEAKQAKVAKDMKTIRDEVSDSAESVAKKASSGLDKLWGIERKKVRK